MQQDKLSKEQLATLRDITRDKAMNEQNKVVKKDLLDILITLEEMLTKARK